MRTVINFLKSIYTSKEFTTISSFFKTRNSPLNLGRWKRENEQKTNLKIDYANDDHCGVCSSSSNDKK
jgi:hypothetical protein